MTNINEMISNIIQENPEPEQLNTALNSFLNTEVFIEQTNVEGEYLWQKL